MSVDAINASGAMALNPYVGVTQDERGPLVRLTGVNLQVVNGLNSTETINGLGNVIVGYDETAPASVTAGFGNRALDRTATGDYSWVAGGRAESY